MKTLGLATVLALLLAAPVVAATAGNWVRLSAIPPPPLHRTETKKSEADQAEGRGFGDLGRNVERNIVEPIC